jgi:hypothetical protein
MPCGRVVCLAIRAWNLASFELGIFDSYNQSVISITLYFQEIQCFRCAYSTECRIVSRSRQPLFVPIRTDPPTDDVCLSTLEHLYRTTRAEWKMRNECTLPAMM